MQGKSVQYMSPYMKYRSRSSGVAAGDERKALGARSIQQKFPEISVQNSMDRFGPTREVSRKRVHLLRWTYFPGLPGWNFDWMDRALDNIDLNQMSHRYISGVLQNDWNDPLDFRSLDRSQFELVWDAKRSILSFPVYITKKMLNL